MLPVTSYSQNSYQVEYTAGLSKYKENTSKQEGIIIAVEMFLDKVETGSHPYAEAAFLEQASSLGIAYIDTEITTTSFDIDFTDRLLLASYVVPNSLFILQAGYAVSDGDIKNGVNGTSEADTIILGIGKYLNNHSALSLNYTQQDNSVTILPATFSDAKNTLISIDYKLIEEFPNGNAYNFEASITSAEFEFNAISETNTIIDFSGDYYYDQSTSVGVSIDLNTGDDKADEGKTLGVNISKYLTPVFALMVDYNKFSADNISGEDSDTVVISGTARF